MSEEIIIKKKISPTMELIKSAWEIYRQRFWTFVGMGLTPVLGAIPLVAVILMFVGAKTYITSQPASQISYIILGVLGLAAMFFLIYIALTSQAGLILLLKNGGNKIGENFKVGRVYAWPLLAVGFLTGVLVLLWSILFIIPGIIFSFYYCFSGFVAVVEDKRNMQALKRSKELVKNYWWPVVGRVLLLSLIAMIVSGILSAPLNGLPEDSAGFRSWNAVIQIISFLYGQFNLIFCYLIFKDLQQIKAQQ